MTIVIIARNQKEEVINCLSSIKKFKGEEVTRIIVVDNASTDNTLEWLSAQHGISLIGFEAKGDGEQGYGKIINTVLKEFEILDDLLIIKAQYMILEHSLEELKKCFDIEGTAAAGGVSNGFFYPQNTNACTSYDEMIEYEKRLPKEEGIAKVLGLNYGAVLFKANVINKESLFSSELYTEKKTFEDTFLTLISKDYQIVYNKKAVFFDQKGLLSITDNEKAYMEDAHILMKKWGMNYFNQSYNNNLIRYIENEEPMKKMNILEMGCDCGATLLEIKNRFPMANCFGVELNPNAAKIASHFAEISQEDIEQEKFPYEAESLDYIIFGDVLEHLKNPYKTLMYCRTLLKKDGCIISSIPNLMHISVMEQLLNGNFEYTDTGLLDSTHIHMFTYNEIIKIFSKAGYEIEEIGNTVVQMTQEQKDLIVQLVAMAKNAQSFMYETYQYILKARKKEVDS